MADPAAQVTRRRADHRGVRAALAVSLFALAALAPAAQAATGETQIVIGRDPGLSRADRADIRRDADVTLDRTLRVSNTEVVTTDDPKAALAALRSDPDVRYAQVVQYRHTFSADAFYGYQWGLENTGENFIPDYSFPTTADADMDVPEAWTRGVSGSGVSVGVVDTGTSAGHPDLAGQIDTARSRGFVTGDPSTDYVDGNEHGTHVSGIIAAKQDTTGISGIAYGSKIVAMRVLDDAGHGSDPDIADAFDYAGDIGLKVVNASLGGTAPAPLIADAIASHPNTLYVIAAGNGGTDGVGDDNDSVPTYPCASVDDHNLPLANVVCVGASDEFDGITDFSNFGHATVDLFAPGQDIYSTVLGNSWGFLDGTSMATPAVAAEAALILAAQPKLSTAQVKSIVLHAVDAKPAFDGLSVSGGRANADVAVAEALHTTPSGGGGGTPTPTPTHPAPAPPATVTPPAPVNTGDKDSDGRADPLDACPAEAAHTPDGCPKPKVRNVKVKIRKHRARVSVTSDRAATVAIKVERRTCNSHGKKCRWRMVYSSAKLSRHDAASFTSRKLRRGKYRVSVQLSATAGRAKLVRKSFKA
jgi:thermitase